MLALLGLWLSFFSSCWSMLWGMEKDMHRDSKAVSVNWVFAVPIKYWKAEYSGLSVLPLDSKAQSQTNQMNITNVPKSKEGETQEKKVRKTLCLKPAQSTHLSVPHCQWDYQWLSALPSPYLSSELASGTSPVSSVLCGSFR